ncbi:MULTISPECIES: carbohydrate ABC transporter permease [Clostridia]|uniref:carbohydrate ABC transporter permease n=1 Tax=Clostridia TaxID=186801 RepID=UPI0007406883|nr:carbohydrate ABC transporter permease [Clostridium sp. C105KSO13]CUX21936.1 L-arabinose transport system permease protein AraQ [Clostridium sp. C105KSO13]
MKKRYWKKILLYAAALAMAAVILTPFLWVLSTALKSDSELFVFPPRLFPEKMMWENFGKAWHLIDFKQSFLNSFLVTVPTALMTVLFCAMAAYAFTRMKFKRKNAVFLFYLSTMMIPQVVRLIPSFALVKDMGLLNSYTGMILPLVAWSIPFGTFLIRQFFMGIPKELDESAKMDGAGHFRIFLSIILPNAIPAMMTLGTYIFITSWNNLIWMLVSVSKEQKYTITLALATMTGPSVDFIPPWNQVMAATLISIVPVLIMYLLLQKYFIQSVSMSGIKG